MEEKTLTANMFFFRERVYRGDIWNSSKKRPHEGLIVPTASANESQIVPVRYLIVLDPADDNIKLYQIGMQKWLNEYLKCPIISRL